MDLFIETFNVYRYNRIDFLFTVQSFTKQTRLLYSTVVYLRRRECRLFGRVVVFHSLVKGKPVFHMHLVSSGHSLYEQSGISESESLCVKGIVPVSPVLVVRRDISLGLDRRRSRFQNNMTVSRIKENQKQKLKLQTKTNKYEIWVGYTVFPNSIKGYFPIYLVEVYLFLTILWQSVIGFSKTTPSTLNISFICPRNFSPFLPNRLKETCGILSYGEEGLSVLKTRE